jgi:signal transduction histidine kinase
VIVRVIGPVLSPRTWQATIHVLFDLIFGVFVFAVMIAAFTVFVSTLCTIVAIPIVLYAVLLVGRLLGKIERARIGAVLDVHIPDPYPTFSGTIWERIRDRFLCGAAWRELGFLVISFPLALIGFTVTFTLWCVSFALVGMPLYVDHLPGETAHLGLLDVHEGPGMWLAAAIGAFGLLVTPWVARGWAALDVFVARNLLGKGVTAELEARVDVLEATRAWALEVAEAERRRIERDLHDGAQQRLVALAIDLGMAREKLDQDPERARELIDHAHGEAKRALVELRDLARGIHPAVLGDQGLPGALPVLIRRCPVPVELELDVPERPPASIEGMAYFIVSECLTNVAKHASAQRVGVRVTSQHSWLIVEVGDDGVGGASTALGTGLAGLADRVASVDGRFEVSSPIGGPTVVRAELPCAS